MRKSTSARSAKRPELPGDIVSYIPAAGGDIPLSLYRDDTWEFAGFTTNVAKAARRMNFKRIPPAFRDVAKRTIYTYRANGRRNRRRPADSFVFRVFISLIPFFRYLDHLGLRQLSRVGPVVCSGYVDAVRSEVRPNGKKLAGGTMQLRFHAVEVLHDVTQADRDGLRRHPWPDTSAQILAGIVGANSKHIVGGKTPIIPDRILKQLFQAATEVVGRAPLLLEMRDAWASSDDARIDISSGAYHAKYNEFLAARGWEFGARAFKRALTDIRTSCYIIVAALSGCRNHELAYIQRGAVRSDVRNGERYWWLRSKSTKTRMGDCEWMIPSAAADAIRILERWAKPYQARIRADVRARSCRDGSAAAQAAAEQHQDALFLSCGNRTPATLDQAGWCYNLDDFAARRGIDWKPRSHQFRRTFAIYAARSALGDLRYLKRHFKHWSMDMTLLYALSEYQEHDLLSDIAGQVEVGKRDIVSEWMDSSTKLAGGGGKRLARFRSESPVRLYRSRSDMVKAVAQTIHIRSNGHAWCTADRGAACSGNIGLNQTRCATCSHAVIGQKHLNFYVRMRNDLVELMELRDIGECGINRIRRDIARCDEVIGELTRE